MTILLPIRQASGTGRGSRHIIRDFSPSLEKSRDLPAALHRRQAKFRPPRSSHPSITRRLFARADRSMMYGMIRFLPRALNNSPEGAVPPFFLSFLPRTYRCTSRNFGRNWWLDNDRSIFIFHEILVKEKDASRRRVYIRFSRCYSMMSSHGGGCKFAFRADIERENSTKNS